MNATKAKQAAAIKADWKDRFSWTAAEWGNAYAGLVQEEDFNLTELKNDKAQSMIWEYASVLEISWDQARDELLKHYDPT